MSTKSMIFEAHMKTVNLNDDECIKMFCSEILPLFEAKTVSMEQRLGWADIKQIFKNITEDQTMQYKAIEKVKSAFNASKTFVKPENLSKLKSKAINHINLLPEKNQLRQKFDNFVRKAESLNDTKWLSAICGAILTTATGNPDASSIIFDIVNAGMNNVNKASKYEDRVEPSISSIGDIK